MTKLEALQALAEKVEVGSLDWPYCAVQHVHGIGMNETIWDAYNGSLDAAKALMEAVLPEWFVRSILQRGHDIWCATIWPDFSVVGMDDMKVGKSTNPARAWLLSILKALIAEEGE